ncbi:organic cation transporter protein-like [Trichogramma pretiosum]|uniref:organic cation transporter protein-like n=1 Tax=Trichogramma pretiosum TaxID=7493 RepID=UPI0006C94F32|nr:organic cation transporter protein-like [Trichogramma pretiosum]
MPPQEKYGKAVDESSGKKAVTTVATATTTVVATEDPHCGIGIVVTLDPTADDNIDAGTNNCGDDATNEADQRPQEGKLNASNLGSGRRHHHLNNHNNNNNSDKQIAAAAVKDVDFDDLLPYIGEFGRYQKILFCLMIPFAFYVAWVYFSQIFITLVPEQHWCRVPELEHLDVEDRVALAIPAEVHGTMEGRAKCLMYDVNYTDILERGIMVGDPSWPKKPCDNGWEFNFTVIPYATIATELEWVCDNAALPTFAQSIFFVGAIFGGLIFGWIADRYGRIPALVGANCVGFVSGCATMLATNFWQFALCRFVFGFAFDNCFTMMYILVLEYVGPRWRTFVANMSIAMFFTLAASGLPWIAYFIADWRMLCLATSAPLVLAVLTPCFVPESARWLVSQGKVDRAMTILAKFERINRTHVPRRVYRDFQDTCARIQKEEEADKSYSVIDLFRTKRLRNITVLLVIIWMAISLVFDGHVRNVDNLRLDVFVTFTVASATELPADTFLTLVLDRWGRRWLACGSMVVSGVFSLWACLVSNNIYAATLAIMGRFCVNISYNIGLQYAAELLPTVVRAQGVALIHIMGYVASIIAPFVVYLKIIAEPLPLLVLGVLGILGGFLALFLPETLDKDLPQTLQDGEEFGRDQGLWDMPCLMKKADDAEQARRPQPAIIRRSSTLRSSRRASIRGETWRSSMIQRASIRSRASATTPTVEEERL